MNLQRGLILKRHRSFLGAIEGNKDEIHSDRSFGIKWYYIAESAMTDWPMKSILKKCKWSQMFSNIMN